MPDPHDGELFRRIATRTAHAVGQPSTFAGAVAIVLVWALSGHFFSYSDTWQLVINTGTTIVTFLMVFLIQNTQNRDAHAMHLKLDELIHAHKRARDRMMMLEALSEAELDELQHEFDRLAREKVNARRTPADGDAYSDAAPSPPSKARTSSRRIGPRSERTTNRA